MIDILRHKPFFPLKNFEDVQKLFEFNIDENNGEPNLALLSIVLGLIEHSLVTVTDKDDLAYNSRPVDHRKNIIQRKNLTHRLPNPSSSSQHYHLSSTSNEVHKSDHHHQHHNNNNNHNQTHNNNNNNNTNPNPRHDQQSTLNGTEFNEAGYVSSDNSNESNISSPDPSANDNLSTPEIEFEIVETLYKRFYDQFKGSIDFKDIEVHKTNLKIKKISDSVWEHLSNSYYKDKAHLQSVFSYLTTSKLDCFGLAFAVIAGCQILNLKNIYLALSEDHAWVMFDLRPDESSKASKDKELKEYTENDLPIPTCAVHGTCEVTWHGKANSDKRGQPVTYKNCWLYTNGYAVKCDIKLCVAALVNSINPTINSNTDSEILALLQQRLLWLLFRRKIYFPMSLGNLGELENICPTPTAPLTPHELFNLGIEISRKAYNDAHVYPYSYLASFFFKHGRFKEAFETWADASAVMTKYYYSRDDEEIYKEFSEIANELIPSMLKVVSAGELEPGQVSQKPTLQDPECLALILKFYDNICCWEEGSPNAILHSVWVKNFLGTVSKFTFAVRSKIKLLTEGEWSHNKACASECEVSSRADQCSSTESDQIETKNGPDSNRACINDTNNVPTSDIKAIKSENIKGRKRALSFDDKVDTSESSLGKIKTEDVASPEARYLNSRNTTRYPVREKQVEVDSDGNVTVILKSHNLAGLRDVLLAERLNKTAIQLQLTAQSQCTVRGRSNSSSYSSDFISSTLTTTGGSTRSKRHHR